MLLQGPNILHDIAGPKYIANILHDIAGPKRGGRHGRRDRADQERDRVGTEEQANTRWQNSFGSSI